MDLLQEWAEWEPDIVPHVLEADRDVLFSPRGKAVSIVSNWQEAYRDERFGAKGDGKLELGLLPQPFCGDLRRAGIYVLLLNPGLNPSDYYEYEVPEFRQALLDNLSQGQSNTASSFLFLDPRFGWHAGFGWWQAKLAEIIDHLAHERKVTHAFARKLLASRLASIELVPYHSATSCDRWWIRRLPSVALAREFVKDALVPRVQKHEAIVIILRQSKEWGLEEQQGMVVYDRWEAQGAYLSPRSRGGDAILEYFAERPWLWEEEVRGQNRNERLPVGTLFNSIRKLVADEKYIIGLHASERLEERGIMEWQVVAALEEGELISERPGADPNPAVEVRECLPDGTEFKAVWSLLRQSGVPKLVTVHFFDEN